MPRTTLEKKLIAFASLRLIPVGQVADYLAGSGIPTISRQAVHKAIQLGKLGSFRSLHAPGKSAVVLVDPDEVKRYLQDRG